MKKLIVSGVMFLFLACAVAPALSPLPADDAGWVPLFNGHNFDGWYTFLPSTGKNKDPKGVFKVEKGMIHVFDIPVTNEKQEFGYLATNQELSHCRIRAEFKFGEKRFVPRQEDKRDSGLLYYFVGPDKVWPRSLECQIQETDVGDLWILDGPSITTKIETPDYPVYSTGPLLTKNKGRIIKSGGRYSHVFAKPGTYQYFCAIHPDMSATVLVPAPGGSRDGGWIGRVVEEVGTRDEEQGAGHGGGEVQDPVVARRR